MEYYYCKISIHAPTRGATGSIAGKLGGLDFNPRSHERSDSIATTIASKSFLISIHAPTRGATLYTLMHTGSPFSFQSTLPREERPVSPISMPAFFNISIHAPTRGATTSTVPSAVSGVFQSTLPREERQ